MRYVQNYNETHVYLKKNQNAPRPSEHPPVRGEKKFLLFLLFLLIHTFSVLSSLLKKLR